MGAPQVVRPGCMPSRRSSLRQPEGVVVEVGIEGMGSLSFSNIPWIVLVGAASTRCPTRLVIQSYRTRGRLCHGNARTPAQEKLNATAGLLMSFVVRVPAIFFVCGRVSLVRVLVFLAQG